MAVETFEIFLPCEIIEIRVAVAPTDAVTELEQYVLRAIGESGVGSVESLVRLFGLQHRPTLDLVHGLWNRGHVEVVMPGSKIQLSPVAREYLSHGRLKDLPGGEIHERTERVIRDLVSGHFLQPRPPARLDRKSRRIPTILQPGVLADSDRAELLRVLSARTRITVGGRREKLLAAQLPILASGAEPVQTKSRMIRLLARVWREPEVEGLRFEIVHPADIPVLVRRDLASRLAAISVERPSDVFFKQLNDSTRAASGMELDVDAVSSQLAQLVSTFDDLEPHNAPRAHEACSVLAETLRDLTIEHQLNRADVRILAGAEEISAEVIAAIRKSQSQLVIVCPFVNVRGFQQLRDPLTDLLNERNVDVFVMWGIGTQESLPPPVAAAFRSLQTRAGKGRLHISDLPARTHAKLVVSDADLAIVGSNNFLNWRDDPLAEVAAVIELSDARPAPAVGELLRWVARVFPDYALGRRIRTSFETVSNAETLDQPTASPLATWSPPPAPSGTNPFEFALWRKTWERNLAELGSALNDRETRARLVIDEEHRSMLWKAIAGSRRRLLIASDALSDEVVDERFTYNIRKRLEEVGGPQITMVFNRPVPPARLRSLKEQYGDRLQLVTAANHAKVLAWDDRALISSFNFLSFDGMYQGRLRRRVRSEIGVLIDGPSAFETVKDALARQSPDLSVIFRGARGLTDAARAPSGPQFATPAMFGNALLHLIRDLDGTKDTRERRQTIKNCFANLPVEDVWRSLDALSETEFPGDDLEICVAAVLVRRDLRSDSGERGRWLRWFASRAWCQGRRFEATLMLHALDKDGVGLELPSATIAGMAALVGSLADTGEMWAGLQITGMPDAHQETLGALAAIVVLRGGVPSAGMVLGQCKNASAPELRNWLDEIEVHWRMSAAVPLIEIAAQVELIDAIQRERESRLRLKTALDAAANRHFNFTVGSLTFANLFSDEGAMQSLKAACERDDLGAATKWLAEVGEGDQDIAHLMDEATARAVRGGKHDGEYIDGVRRRSSMAVLKDIVLAARMWVDSRMDSRVADERTIRYAMRLGRSLLANLANVGDLLVRRTAERHPAAPIIADLIEVLDPVFRLANRSASMGEQE